LSERGGAHFEEPKGDPLIKNIAVAIAVSAIACATWASSASAKQHPKHTPAAPAQAGTIPGVNPMTNAAPIPAVDHPAPYVRVQGVNPM
jgi:hypothetical protein